MHGQWLYQTCEKRLLQLGYNTIFYNATGDQNSRGHETRHAYIHFRADSKTLASRTWFDCRHPHICI